MTETTLLINNTPKYYRRKLWMYLRLQQLENQKKYDRDKAPKMFKLLTDDVNRDAKKQYNTHLPKEDRRKAQLELRKEYESKDWKEEAKDEFPEKYRKVHGGWHTVTVTMPSGRKSTEEKVRKSDKRIKKVRSRKSPKSMLYRVQVQYYQTGEKRTDSTPSRKVSRRVSR